MVASHHDLCNTTVGHLFPPSLRAEHRHRLLAQWQARKHQRNGAFRRGAQASPLVKRVGG